MLFLVAFPVNDQLLTTLTVTLEKAQQDAILARSIVQLSRLRISEYMLISNRYLVIRIQ